MVLIALWALAAGLLASFAHHVGSTPILGALLWASCFLRRRDVLLIGLGAMLIHDAVLGLSAFTLVRLVATAGVVGTLWLVRVRPAPIPLLAGLALSAPVYHVLLAAGDWATQFCSKAPHTPTGFWSTMASALPYAQRAFLGDLAFTGVFFGLYTLAGYLVTLRWPSALPRSAGT